MAMHQPSSGTGDNLFAGEPISVREGIPVFLGEVDGNNRRYQTMYDRIAIAYDAAERIGGWIVRQFRNARREFVAELELPAGATVLEVSIGTGANVPYLPADARIFGLDLSWGMLRRCRRNLRKWHRDAELCQGEAERLPYRDAVFDSVFHIGGINFFNDRAAAIREMIRVARPGAKIVISDEMEKVVRNFYARMPFVRHYFKNRTEPVVNPVDLVPPGMAQIRTKEIIGGRLYVLSFRKPAAG